MDLLKKYSQLKEVKRLQELLSYNILDTPYEQDFDGLVELISIICDSPVAIISLIDAERQWYKAKKGVGNREVPVQETFCRHTLLQDEILEIQDARLDERVKDNPHVTAENGIRFYAGIPIKTAAGYNIGTVCVVDTKPKQLSENQKKALRLLTEQALMLLEARKKNNSLGNEVDSQLRSKVKETEQQLIQKENEYKRLLKAIKRSSGVIEFSPDGRIKKINQYFLETLGYKKEELVGRHHRILLDEESKKVNKAFWEELCSGSFKRGRLRRLHKDGSEVWIQATYNPVMDSFNKIIKVIKIGQDITREFREEKAIKKAKDTAEALNVQKDNFIANVSHELRTPIHAILGFTELLLEEEINPVKKNYLKSVKTAGDNLLFIINDILDLSKIEAGIIQMESEVFSLKLVIENVFSILHLKAHQKKILFHFHIQEGLNHNIRGDKNRLTQILLNILGNAIKFTAVGRVELFVSSQKISAENSLIEFKVLDTGIGIAPEKLNVIFERFSQAEDTTSRQFGGTGLGLNISKQLIEKQQGSILVESETGKGSVFTFSIPFAIGNALPGENSNQYKIAQKLSGTKILLCEDNELNQCLAKAILNESGCSVDLAENGQKGLVFLKDHTYDLILMDIQMPVLDGYQTTSIIRKDLKLKTPILALTANFLISERQKCLEEGMTDYLPKPFTKEELIIKIEHMLSVYKHKITSPKLEYVDEKGVVDLQVLRELSGGDLEFEKEMISLFKAQAASLILEMELDVNSHNYARVRTNAHKLKTSFGMIGADLLFLNTLETIPVKDPVEKNIRQTLLQLQDQLQKIMDILKN